MAADRARRFMTSLQTLSDESLQLIHDDVRNWRALTQRGRCQRFSVIWSLVKSQYSACWNGHSGRPTPVNSTF